MGQEAAHGKKETRKGTPEMKTKMTETDMESLRREARRLMTDVRLADLSPNELITLVDDVLGAALIRKVQAGTGSA